MKSFFNSSGHRHRQGIVHAHPKTDAFGRRATMFGAVSIGAAAAGIALATGFGTPQMRAFMGLGGALAFGLVGAKAYRDNPSVAAISLAGAGVAGLAAYGLVSKNATQGLRTFSNYVSKSGSRAVVDGAANSVAGIQKVFPSLEGFLAKEGLALGVGLLTIPIAHSLMVKHFAAEKRRTTDHGETGFMAAWQDNKAGSTAHRRSNDPLLAYNSNNAADVNFSGSVSSHYDAASIFNGG